MADIAAEIDGLQRLTTSELVERFGELHGYPCRTRHRAYLKRKIAWRIQAKAEGDLRERARRRAAELASACSRLIGPGPGNASSADRLFPRIASGRCASTC